MCLDCSISIGDIIAAFTGVALAIFAFLQYRINKRQAEHQHTTTSIDYCKQLMEFFDVCEKDWDKMEEDYQKEIRGTFDKAVEEQKEGIPNEVRKEIEKLIEERNFLDVIIKICPLLRLTGTEFQIFLNRLSNYISRCGSHMDFVLKGLQGINLDMLNYHQVLLIQKRIFHSAPCFSFYFDWKLQEIENIEKQDPFTDGWRDNMKNKLPVLSNLASNIGDRATFLSELYSDEYSEGEKDKIKKKFAEKNWNTEGLWR
ncbi:hypothetical protein [Fibrobacter sp.]|uniref:hypothetical protein n=1 Tax=Fibrobacter sp. TaxID=35828 RepID=UPI0038651F34